MTTLLASAPTLDDIRAPIRDFYVGTPITLIPADEDAWKLVRTSDGKELTGVRVIRKRNRIRFEMEP